MCPTFILLRHHNIRLTMIASFLIFVRSLQSSCFQAPSQRYLTIRILLFSLTILSRFMTMERFVMTLHPSVSRRLLRVGSPPLHLHLNPPLIPALYVERPTRGPAVLFCTL